MAARDVGPLLRFHFLAFFWKHLRDIIAFSRINRDVRIRKGDTCMCRSSDGMNAKAVRWLRPGNPNWKAHFL